MPSALAYMLWKDMIMRHIIRSISLILVLASFGLIGVTAQAPDWEAWMYNSENGRMIRIGSDRSIYDDFTLPGLQGNFYSYQVVVSPDGRIILYTLTNQNNGTISVYAYDTVVNAIAASYIIPSQQGQLVYTNIDLSENEKIFSPDSTSVAIGYSIDGEWSIVVMDLFGTPGNISQQLNESDPIASSVTEIALDVPVIMNYDGFVIDFVIIPAATEGFPAYPHYTYDSRTNSVSSNIYYSIPYGDFNPRNGSYVFPIADFRFSPADPRYQERSEHINSLYVHQAGTDTIYPIYYSPDTSVSSSFFIQNGERILFRQYSASTFTSDWVMMNDLGAGQFELFAISGWTDFFASGIESTGDGMLMSMNTGNAVDTFDVLASYPNRSVLMSFNTRTDNTLAGGGTIIWIGEENQNYELVWATDNQEASRALPPVFSSQFNPVDFQTYGTLSPLAQSLIDSYSATASGAPISGNLTVGGQAQIFTTDGDRANMRGFAGLGGQIVERLANGVIVNVIGGPQSNDGFVWWQVQFGTTTGWVVESADGVRVLQPYGVVTPTLVPTPVAQPPSNANPTLVVGGSAIVTSDGNNLNARQQATTTASVVAVYQTNETINIIGGPFENEGFVWWQINTQFGPAWVAQGNATEQWIIGANG